MCLALPGEVLSLTDGPLPMARVAFGSIQRDVCVAYTPDVRVGDYVVVHVGFAISVLDEAEAARTLAALAEAARRIEGER